MFRTSDGRTIDPARYVFHPGEVEVSDIDLDEEVVIMDGRRYTETDAAADAQWLERTAAQRAAARQRGLRKGGESMSADGAHSPRVTVTLPRDVADAVKAQAKAEGMSVSKYVRRLVSASVASR